MVITDPIGDMLMRIRNAGVAGKKVTHIPFSDLKLRIANVLVKEGYLVHVAKKIKKGKTTMRVLEVEIAYEISGAPKIKGAERISRPSRRLYSSAKELRPVHQGYGILILSTPKGIYTDTQARKEHVGGELICKVW